MKMDEDGLFFQQARYSCHSCCLAHYQQSGMDKEEAAEPQPAQADCKSLRYSLNSCNECRERLRWICIANLDEIALDSLMILMLLFFAFYYCNSTMIPYLGNNYVCHFFQSTQTNLSTYIDIYL